MAGDLGKIALFFGKNCPYLLLCNPIPDMVFDRFSLGIF